MLRILLISLIFTSIAGFADSCDKSLQSEIQSLEEVYALSTNSQTSLNLSMVFNNLTDLEVREKAIEQIVNVLKLGGVATLIDRTGWIYHREDVATLLNSSVTILDSNIQMIHGWPVRTLKFQKQEGPSAFFEKEKHHTKRPFSKFE